MIGAGDAEARTRIVEGPGRQSFFVEAAAGTGKTSILVERTVALLTRGEAEVDRLAVITFTRKAAGELKLRLRERLERARARAQGEARRRLERSIAHLEDAVIDTIHGFCGHILRARPIEAGVNPEMTVGETDPARIRRVLDRWFAEQLSDPPPGLRRFLARARVGWGGRTPLDALAALTSFALERRELDAPWPRPRIDETVVVETLRGRVEALAEILARGEAKDPLTLALAPLRETAEALAEAPLDPAMAEARLIALAGDLDQALKPRARLERGFFLEDLPAARVVAQADALRTDLKELARLSGQDVAALLREEIRDVVARYERLCRQTAHLDYDELLVRTRDLLRDRPEARAAIAERFSHVLVDELQDTDPVQTEIVLGLHAEGRGSVTVVGDPKQSIYGFRRADPASYEAAREQLLARGAERIELGTSHRSVRPLQDFVNATFGPRFEAEDGGPRYVPLSGGPDPIPDQPCLVALPAAWPVDGRGRVTARQVRASHPEDVAGFVAWLVRQSGWRVREGAERRPVEARDVCLVFRNFTLNGELMTAPFQAALEARGIENVLVGARVLHRRDEIEATLTALTALEWPGDELAVWGALSGPFFALSADELFRFRTTQGALHPYRRYATEGLAEAQSAVVDALDQLRTLSRARNRRPYAETVEKLLRGEVTRGATGFALRPDGRQALANLERVLEIARQHDREGLSFRGFVEALRALADQPRTTEGGINEEATPGVRLITAHRAKGLEFPVVILADPTVSVRSFASAHAIPERRLAVCSVGGMVPAPLDEAAEALAARERSEALRLAYVAATRARDLLVVPTVGRESRWIAGARPSWVAPLIEAIEPAPLPGAPPRPSPVPGAPPFGDRSLAEPGFESHPPGLVRVTAGVEAAWWDPNVLPPPPPARAGLLDERYLAEGPGSAPTAERHRRWAEAREEAIDRGSYPSLLLAPRDDPAPPEHPIAERRLAELSASGIEERRRFGRLVHRVARDHPWTSAEADPAQLVRLHGRALGAPEAEIAAASTAARRLAADDVVLRARRASWTEQAFPVVRVLPDGTVVDEVVDLLFEEPQGLVGVAFVTREDGAERARTRLGRALSALAAAGRRVRSGVVLVLD